MAVLHDGSCTPLWAGVPGIAIVAFAENARVDRWSLFACLGRARMALIQAWQRHDESVGSGDEIESWIGSFDFE
ncbi:hypothetical protein TRIATDRAFT_305844 [Trichoderma atroviride IMI 206040]|uniref:Uncharacterized protein n=1 Tax=Hypocrea atroviridis (strain ATCC 20476 / IMI 206040) TaxID=452589 RepID=G9NMG7_HYPAI|nr:uncharacterized protein TRIATDRAFT_305844 [Trichoderma atroviride IMI 206040]EHK48097.1 hypothetical protein TRIATDRAFT_305844 [Trichoderma atroviride IMI 206040]